MVRPVAPRFWSDRTDGEEGRTSGVRGLLRPVRLPRHGHRCDADLPGRLLQRRPPRVHEPKVEPGVLPEPLRPDIVEVPRSPPVRSTSVLSTLGALVSGFLLVCRAMWS